MKIFELIRLLGQVDRTKEIYIENNIDGFEGWTADIEISFDDNNDARIYARAGAKAA